MTSNSFRTDIQKVLASIGALDDAKKKRVEAMQAEMLDYVVNIEIPIWEDVAWRRHKGDWDFWIVSSFPDAPRRLLDMNRMYRASWLHSLNNDSPFAGWCLGAIVHARLVEVLQERERMNA